MSRREQIEDIVSAIGLAVLFVAVPWLLYIFEIGW